MIMHRSLLFSISFSISGMYTSFLYMFQKEIYEVARLWNTHRIRPSKNQNVPSGVPLLMYTAPSLYATRDYLRHVQQDKLDVCQEECMLVTHIPCDHELFELFLLYMEEQNLEVPSDASQAVDLYFHLRNALQTDL